MTSAHDTAVVDQLRRSRESASVVVDDPVAVGHAVAAATGGRLLSAPELADWLAEAEALRTLAERVLAADAVVSGVHASDQSQRRALLAASVVGERPPSDAGAGPSPAEVGGGDGPQADRQALRFAVVILVLAQIAGVAVYAVDGDRIAISAPAVALLVVAGVVVSHRRPVRRRPPPSSDPPAPEPGAGDASVGDVPPSPAVRAAEAHRRRQEAAWKLAWWERGLAPVPVADWAAAPDQDRSPATLVVADPDRTLDGSVHAAMAAALPAAIRVVLVRPRL